MTTWLAMTGAAGDVLEASAVGDRTDQRHVDLHQEVRGDGHVVALGQVGHLQPWCDPADPGHVDLDHRARVLLEVVAKVPDAVQRLAHGDGDRAVAGQVGMAGDIVGR